MCLWRGVRVRRGKVQLGREKLEVIGAGDATIWLTQSSVCHLRLNSGSGSNVIFLEPCKMDRELYEKNVETVQIKCE